MKSKHKPNSDIITSIMAIISLLLSALDIILGFYQNKFFPLIYVGASCFTVTVFSILCVFDRSKENKIME